MVQVIYEEGTEEYWQKPLREAILNIGNSWAGSIIRRQNSAASYAKNAADRAHEAYIAQIGINSREKIAGASLAATKERNETLNKQYTSSHELQQRKVQNDEDHTAYLRGQDLDSYNAISAVQELKDAQGFKVDASGSIVPRGLDKANYLRVRNTIKKSPTVWAASQNNVDAYDGEMRKVRRRLSMLRALSKKDVNVYNKLLTGMPPQEGQDPITTDKLVGSGGQGMLNDIAARVGDDIGWKALLKNYEIDDVTFSSLKSHEHDALTDHGMMLGDTPFSIGNHPFKPNDGDQLGRTKSYFRGKKHFGEAFSPSDTDNNALFAAINGLDESHTAMAKNTTDFISSAATNFMQKNGVYFTNEKGLTSQMRTNITKVAQAGPDPKVPLTDPTNLAIHSLMFDKGTPAEKRAKANEIMRTFVKAQGWHKTNKIRSVVKNRPASAPEIAKLFDSPPDSLVDEKTLKETDAITLGDAGSQDSSVINPQANASDGPSPSNIHSFASAGFDSEKLIKYLTKSGKLYDEATDRTVSNGMVTGSKINLLTIPVDELNNIIYSGRTDTPETTFFTKKLKDMAAIAEKAPEKIPTPFDYPTASKEEYSKITKAWATKENLLALYKTNQEIGEQVMLLDPSKLFGQNGQPLGWQDSINKEPPGARIDWKTIKATFSGHPHIFSQFEAIFEGLGLSKTDLDDGSKFGIGQRIRNLAKSETFNLNNRQFIPVSK